MKKHNNIKLCVFDIDGTLKEKGKPVGQNVIRWINTLQAKGVRFTVATGRGFPTAIEGTRPLTFNTPLIILDGSVVVSSEKKVIARYPLADLEIRSVRDFARENRDQILFMGFWKNTLTDLILWTDNEYRRKITEELPTVSKTFLPTGEAVIKEALTEKPTLIFIKTRDKLPVQLHYNATYNDDTLNFIRQGINKAHAIKILCTELNIQPCEVAVFGDDDNDECLFTSDFGLTVFISKSESKSHISADITAMNLDDFISMEVM